MAGPAVVWVLMLVAVVVWVLVMVESAVAFVLALVEMFAQ